MDLAISVRPGSRALAQGARPTPGPPAGDANVIKTREWTLNVNARRTDQSGRAFKGSQLQIQTYVNRYPDVLNGAIIAAIPELSESRLPLIWVSPLEDDGFREYHDAAFLRALGLEGSCDSLARFWPKNGPVWDALARLEDPSTGTCQGAILVEAKSYPDEMRSSGSGASAPSLKMIEAALDATCQWLGVARTPAWTGSLYQMANRLAHLYFFRELSGIAAWLVSVNFYEDSHRLTSREQWKTALEAAKSELGICPGRVPFYAEVLLPAFDRQAPLEK